MVDDNANTNTISGTSVADNTRHYGYVQLDLESDREIAYIVLNTGDPQSLVNTELIIINNSKTIVYRKDILSAINDSILYI
jgi:hypothetical protein